MGESKTEFELPEKWSIDEAGKRTWRAWRELDHGPDRLVYHDLASGLVLLDIDLSCFQLPVYSPAIPSLLTVNWCERGRCEVDFGNRGSAVVDSGLLCVSTSVAEAFTYPSGSYRGFEIFVDRNQLSERSASLFEQLGIDLSAIDQRLCSLTPAFTMKPTGALAHAVSLMAAQLASSGIGNPALLASTCQLLSCLGAIDPQTSRLPAAYLQKSQRDLARRLHDSIVADPTATPAVEGIAAAYHISAASLRSYFSRMYGSTPAAFARALVMKRAMQLLAEGNAAVSDVALSCGYSNPSKFAAAFKRECGLTPLEFRRQHSLDWDSQS